MKYESKWGQELNMFEHVDSSEKDCNFSIADALEVPQFCTKSAMTWSRKIYVFDYHDFYTVDEYSDCINP